MSCSSPVKIVFSEETFNDATSVADNFAEKKIAHNAGFYARRGQYNVDKIKRDFRDSKLVEYLVYLYGRDFRAPPDTNIGGKSQSWGCDLFTKTGWGVQIKLASEYGGECSWVFQDRGFAAYRSGAHTFWLCFLYEEETSLEIRYSLKWKDIEGLLAPVKLSRLKGKKALYEKDIPESFSVSRQQISSAASDIVTITEGASCGAVCRGRVDIPVQPSFFDIDQ